MKKVVAGLVRVVAGIALSFTSGCVYQANEDVNRVYPANEDVNRIMSHHNAIKKIIGADPNDSYHILEPKKKGDLFRVYIMKENGIIEALKYVDIGRDGIYEIRVPRSKISVPNKLDIKVLPPPKPRKGQQEYLPEERPEEKKDHLL